MSLVQLRYFRGSRAGEHHLKRLLSEYVSLSHASGVYICSELTSQNKQKHAKTRDPAKE